jgi:hypothetical protein
MFQAPTTESKTHNESTRSSVVPGRLAAQYDTGAARMLAAPGNQAALRMPAGNRKPMSPPLRPSQVPMLQRKCACGGDSGAGGECTECKAKREQGEDTLQRKTTAAGGPQAAPSVVHEVLRSPGQPLDGQTRAFMEPHFAPNAGGTRRHSMALPALPGDLAIASAVHPAEFEADRAADRILHTTTPEKHKKAIQADSSDLSYVRVHTDARAGDSARAIHADAYTVGHHIVFGQGKFAPDTDSGRRLLAHELTHVAQQAGPMPHAVQRQVGGPLDLQPDPCITAPIIGKVCGSDAAKACSKMDLPGCSAICKLFGCNKPPKPDFKCPPGFRSATSSQFKGQCCTGDVESEQNCCSPSQIGVNEIFPRCCPQNMTVDASGKCVDASNIPFDPKLCDLPTFKDSLLCIKLPPTPPTPQPGPTTPTAVPAATILFIKDLPMPGAGPTSGVAGSATADGNKTLVSVVATLLSHPDLHVQLEGHASSDRPPGDQGAYNSSLAERRVRLIASELIRRGVDASRIGDSPDTPTLDGCSEIAPGQISCGDNGASATPDPDDRNVVVRFFTPTANSQATP